MLPIVITSNALNESWFQKHYAEFDSCVLQLTDSDIDDYGKACGALFDKYPLKIVGIKVPEWYTIGKVVGSESKFTEMLVAVSLIHRRLSDYIPNNISNCLPIVIKNTLLTTDTQRIAQEKAGLSAHFMYSRKTLIIENDIYYTRFTENLTSELFACLAVQRVFQKNFPVTVKTCFNLAQVAAALRIIDLLETNECGIVKTPMDISEIMQQYKNTCGAAILAHSKRFGIMPGDYMCGFTDTCESALTDTIAKLNDILALNSDSVWLEIHEDDTNNRPELVQSIQLIKSIMNTLES